ncbi:7828_t:CDS:2, partial [Diversispora eburnea]
IVKSGKREISINEIPENYIKIYTKGWKDIPEQRPVIEDFQMNQMIKFLSELQLVKQISKLQFNNELKKFEYNGFENLEGLIKYVDPILFKEERKFSRTKASSVGILLWKISSGKIPYKSYESRLEDELEKLDLISYIIQGNRKNPIERTLQNNVKIYQGCWNQDPDQCSNIEHVI